METIIVGDLHLSDERSWSYYISCKVVDYLLNHPKNIEGNLWIFEGDIVNQAFISGRVIDLMHQLFSGMKAITYVIVGNHDTKKNKNGDITLVYNYLTNDRSNKNVSIIDEPFVASTKEGLKFLMLPYDIRGWDYMKSAYENLPESISKDKYTAILGHFSDTSVPIPGLTINIDYLNADNIILGHYHIPSSHYIGSITPNSIKEAGYSNKLIYFSAEGIREDAIIDKISDYYTVIYPNDLPKTTSLVPIYSIYCCGSEASARDKYGNIYIHKCSLLSPGIEKKASSEIMSSGSSKVETLSIKELFEEWRHEQKAYSETTINLMYKYLF